MPPILVLALEVALAKNILDSVFALAPICNNAAGVVVLIPTFVPLNVKEL